MALTIKEQKRLEKKLPIASQSAIRGIMQRLTKHWEVGHWLSTRNPYRKNCIGQIRNDIKLKKNPAHTDLSEYVAASAIVHCFDGWSYLGRALESEMAGDPDTARHLGYYAELRAAMSVLASEGIGVFQNEHILVTGARQCAVLDRVGGTHDFVWNALVIWSELKVGAEAVFRSIRPGGLPLSDWLDQFPAGTNFVPTGWLRQWGLDLSRLTDDRTARNIASYRPTAFTSPGPRSISDTMKTILQLWQMCNPGANGGFPVLDRYLLRRSLKLVSSVQGGRSSSEELYKQNLERMLASISPRDLPANEWHKFLSYEKLADTPEIIHDANGNDNAYHPDHSKQVLARATLLLRVATGCSADLLNAAKPNIENELKFWRSSPSVRRRLWSESDLLPEAIDLWSDVDGASNSIDQWLEQHGPSASHHALWTDQASAASTLATAERAFLWGVGL